MTTEHFANQAATTLASAVGFGDLSITVQSATHFPVTPEFRVRLSQELMLVTGVAGTTWTVTRGIEGTTAASHAAGTAVTAVLTAGGLDEMRSEIEGEHLTAGSLASATTTIVVSAATAPVAGQVLTATSSTAADWENLALSTPTTPGFQAAARDLKLLFIGDSHTEGNLHAVTVTGAEQMVPTLTNGPLDEEWRGTGALNTIFPLQCAMYPDFDLGTDTGHPSTDGNSATAANAGSWIAWVPTLLRQYYTRFGKIRCANMGYGGSSSYSWSGNNAFGFLQTTGQPNPGDTAIVHGSVITTYTFQVLPSAAYDVLIGDTVAHSMNNLMHAINADGTAGAYGAGTLINPDVFCPNTRADQYLQTVSTAIGAAGNAYTISGTGNIGVLQPIQNGDDINCFLFNAQNILTSGAGFGTPDVVFVLLGTNDAGRQGWGGRGYQLHMQALINNLHTSYPLAKIVLWYPPHTGVPTTNTVISTVINPAIDALLLANSFCSKIDAWDLPAGSASTAILSADGVHLSVLGYQYVSQIAVKAIISALGL